MTTGQKGIDLIEQFEGLRLKAYQDVVGVWTIGYGTTKNVTKGMTITEEQATEFLQRDLAVFEKAINQAVTKVLNQNQFDALACFCYNVGSGNFLKSTLLKKLNAGDNAGAALQFLVWNKAGGKPVAGLTRRRKAESKLFSTPLV
jgi:lysozyme